MKEQLILKLEHLFKKGLITRREFLKYIGMLTGMSVLGSGLKGPAKAHAQTRPRVRSVHNSNATNWDYDYDTPTYYREYINQDVVNDMVARGVMALTGATALEDAWNALIPYQSGEAVAIKVNLNNSGSCGDGVDNIIDALPETVNAVINGLTLIGVPPDKIWIIDPSRTIPGRFINGINNSSVQYYSSVRTCSYENYHLTDYVDNDWDPDLGEALCDSSPTTHPSDDVVRPAQVLVDADHLINIPLLKGHGAGHMSLGMKNHYGSIIFKYYPVATQGTERFRLHEYVEPQTNPDIEKSTLADINNNRHIRDKTRLILGDGLYGSPIAFSGNVIRWNIFNNDSPSILFFGTDVVATDSVMCDYVTEEQGQTVTHSSLHYGEELGLGIHDHWDSFQSKQYSLIDYIHIEGDNPTVTRLDIDRKIKAFKDNDNETSEQEVKDMINEYMELP